MTLAKRFCFQPHSLILRRQQVAFPSNKMLQNWDANTGLENVSQFDSASA